MQSRSLAAVLLLLSTAEAASIDGFYEVVDVTTDTETRTASDLMTEGCWSREVFVIRGNLLSRGHQEVCPSGKNEEVCEAWVTVDTTFKGGLTIDTAAEVLTQSRTRTLTEKVKGPRVKSDRTEGTALCSVRLSPVVWTVTVDTEADTTLLVLDDRQRGVKWRLQPSTPGKAPWSEARD